MANSFQKYFERHFPLDNLLNGTGKQEEELAFNQFRLSARKRAVMLALKFSPWICLVVFSSTFGLQLLSEGATLFGTSFFTSLDAFVQENTWWITPAFTISIAGLIGYGTNYIAIRMLFRPVVKRPIWGQGLIPSQRERIIYTLAQGMHKHILSQELIRRRIEETGLVTKINDVALDGSISLLQDQELRKETKDWVRGSIEEFAGRQDVRQHIREIVDDRLEQNLSKGMERFILQTYKRMNKEKYEEAIDRITEEIPQVAQQIIERLEHQLDRAVAFIRKNKPTSEEQIMSIFIDFLNRIDITDLLAKQMAHFDEARLERMIWEATNEQLLYIQYLGTVLGILGGLIIFKPEVMGPIFLLVFGILYLVDNLLYKLKQSSNTERSSS
ncbi:MAG: DUF445 family protein [Bacteroidota bacterium]